MHLDKLEIMQCDLVIANCPQPSVGTSMEIIYAWEREKPVLIWIPQDVKLSPWLVYHSTFLAHSWDDVLQCVDRFRNGGRPS